MEFQASFSGIARRACAGNFSASMGALFSNRS
jgi:hypothetical protein